MSLFTVFRSDWILMEGQVREWGPTDLGGRGEREGIGRVGRNTVRWGKKGESGETEIVLGRLVGGKVDMGGLAR